MLVCDRVKVPWERVFLDSGAQLQFGARQIFLDTPAMCYANHYSNVRFWSKMGLIAGVALRISEAQGLAEVPAVRETLGEFAAIEAMAGSMAAGQVECFESWPEGYVTPNRRFQFATTCWCMENHNAVIEKLRTLLWENVATASALNSPATTYAAQSGSMPALVSNSKPAEKLRISQLVLEALCRKYRVARLSLFGSASRNALRSDSDVNLLVDFLPGGQTEVANIAGMQTAFAAAFGGREVSIATAEIFSDPAWRDAILADLKVIFES